jgi:hypothetical protein
MSGFQESAAGQGFLVAPQGFDSRPGIPDPTARARLYRVIEAGQYGESPLEPRSSEVTFDVHRQY